MKSIVFSGFLGLLAIGSGETFGQGIIPNPPPPPPAGTVYTTDETNIGSYVNDMPGTDFNVVGDEIALLNGFWIWAPAGTYTVKVSKRKYQYASGWQIIGSPIHDNQTIMVTQGQWAWVSTPHRHDIFNLNDHKMTVTITVKDDQQNIVITKSHQNEFRD